MARPLFTLRLKLTLLYLSVFGVLLGGLSVVLMTMREQFIVGDFDQRLVDRATSMVDAITVAEEKAPGDSTTIEGVKGLIPFRFPGYYFQLVAADGKIIERSENLGELHLPWTKAAQEAQGAGEAKLETIRGELAENLIGKGGELRLLTLYHAPTANRPSFVLQIAVSLAPIRQSIAQLRSLFLSVIPSGLLVAGLASWLLARRALAPIGRIARETRELTAAHLDRRLALPPGRDEVTEMVVTINQMLDRLEAAFRAQERFVANAAHELKTPAAVLLGQAQVLAGQPRSTGEYEAFLVSVQEEMRWINQMVISLLTLARADAGLPMGPVSPVSIHDVVTDVIQRSQAQAGRRGVRLVPMLAMPDAEESEPTVRGDAELLRSMVLNLVQNAVRHSPVGETVEIAVSLRDPDILISVRDRGPGISSEHVEQVFDRFFRVPGSDESGTGLGLAIARTVARMHRGDIEVRNRPDKGCEFTVRLPAGETEPATSDE